MIGKVIEFRYRGEKDEDARLRRGRVETVGIHHFVMYDFERENYRSFRYDRVSHGERGIIVIPE